MECEDGLFFDRTTYDCEKCDPLCDTCDGAAKENYITCSKIAYEFQGECLVTCPEGTVYGTNDCRCMPSCGTCSTNPESEQIDCHSCS